MSMASPRSFFSVLRSTAAAALPWAVLAIGAGYTLGLESRTVENVFFSGDAGLKALMARQFARGELRFDLDLPAEPWVQRLWDQGLYPLDVPFAYVIAGRHYTEYSYPFPLVCAPLYALFGWRGLYVLPLLATWGVWLVLLGLLSSLGVGPLLRALAVGTLVFATPLSFYSAAYWEHNLAVFLAFLGLSRLLRPPPTEGSGGLFWAGAAVGFSAWFREEMLCLVGALLLLAGLCALLGRREVFRPRATLRFCAGMLLVVLLSFVGNVLVYGHPLGVHSFPVMLHGFSLTARLGNAWILVRKLGSYLLETFPSVWFLSASLVLPLSSDRFRGRSQETVALLLGLLFFATVPLVLPDVKLNGDGGKQWGPRFLLLLAPLGTLTAALALRRLAGLRVYGLRWLFLGAFLALFGWGTYQNTVLGTTELVQDYELRIEPAVEFFQRVPEKNIAVEYQHMAQELLLALPEKNFFLTGEPKDFGTLALGLLERGEEHFLYLRYYTDPAPEPVEIRPDGSQGLSITFTEIEQHGIYTVYGAAIERRDHA
jgi:hypothetical protein